MTTSVSPSFSEAIARSLSSGSCISTCCKEGSVEDKTVRFAVQIFLILSALIIMTVVIPKYTVYEPEFLPIMLGSISAFTILGMGVIAYYRHAYYKRTDAIRVKD